MSPPSAEPAPAASLSPDTSAAEPRSEHPPILADGEGCLEILSDRLRESPGITAIEADFRDSTLTVRYQPTQVAPEQLNALADEVGAMFAQRVTYCEQRSSLEACAQCSIRLGRLPAPEAAQFEITAAPGKIGLTRRDAAAGESAELKRPLANTKSWGAKMTPAEQEHLSKGRAMAMLTACCLVLLVSGLVLERFVPQPAWRTVAFVLAAITGGFFALRSSLRALAKFRFDVNLLMIVAALGAGAIGYVKEAAVLMFLFALSNTLEVYTMGRTRRALHALLKLRPARALVRRGGREIEVEAEAVQVGERVIVKPGEAIPVDGAVVLGASLVDQSHLTGESVPVSKEIGDKVFAGTLNQQGAIEVRAARTAGDTTLARIVKLVEEAQEQKSRTEEVAEWVGRYYTVAVMIGAALMIAIPLMLGHEFQTSFYRAMTLLVVASPCALVIATPATVLSAIANAARHGVLFKGGRFIEALGRVRAVAFDKTGTLTRGQFEVTDVMAMNGATENDVVYWAASAEKRSQHPLAQAVVRASEARGLDAPPAEQLTSHLGKGLVARSNGASIEIGTPKLFDELGVAVPPEALAAIERFSRDAKTPMLVRRATQWGVIAACDQVRPAANGVIAKLNSLGVRAVVLISGDNVKTVEAIARQTGVGEYHGALLPEQKVAIVGELEQRHGAVAMVGDGVNDAPALARATVGIAMGGIGSDAAMESADVVLMADDLTALPYALRLSQKARGIVIQNVTIATGVMVVLVLLVFFGHMTPLGALRLPMAVSGHEGSTVIVILNGLRLLGEKRG